MLTYTTYKRIYKNGSYKQYIWNHIKHSLKRIVRIPYCTYMCIKYPFLYPRNRFSGKYETNILSSLINELYSDSIIRLGISGRLVTDSINYVQKYINFFNVSIKLDIDRKILYISNDIDKIEFDLRPLLWKDDKFEIVGMDLLFTLSGSPLIQFSLKTIDENDKTNYGFTHYSVSLKNNKLKYNLYKIFQWIDSKILNKILILPTSTEWDAVEPGWKKAFGKQYLKELKQQLKKENNLYSFRIMQIKEKYGTFRLYANKASQEVYNIINKYENLSYKTCIKCGKPATHVTSGWIAPYCDDCDKVK